MYFITSTGRVTLNLFFKHQDRTFWILNYKFDFSKIFFIVNYLKDAQRSKNKFSSHKVYYYFLKLFICILKWKFIDWKRRLVLGENIWNKQCEHLFGIGIYTHTAFLELFCIDRACKIQSPSVVCHRVFPINKTFRCLANSRT